MKPSIFTEIKYFLINKDSVRIIFVLTVNIGYTGHTQTSHYETQRIMLFEIEKSVAVVRHAHSIFTILTAMDVAGES